MEKKTIDELGEFGLINHLTSETKVKNQSSVYGIGDDCAISNYGDKDVLITSDMLTEGIHFDLVYTPLKHLGYKAVIVNLSDIYAMNGEPQQVVVNIAISSKFSLKAIETLYEGIKEACKRYNVDLVGGDTTTSLTGLVLSVTAVGTAEKGKAVKRNTANKNDLICVTGDLGAAYLGLQLLEREKKIFMKDKKIQPKLDNYEYILERQLKPEARDEAVRLLKENEIQPTSMIDISDGLSSDLLHIATQSGLGCKIFEEKLPINEETKKAASEFNLEPAIPALNGGEDYELLFTVDIKDHKKVEAISDISIIGHMTDKSEEYFLIPPNGNPVPLEAQGWNPILNSEKG